MPLVEQELLTLPEYLNSSSVFSGVRVARSLVVCVCFVDRCLPLYAFLFGIVLSFLLRYTNSDYPFGIFKLFLCIFQKKKPEENKTKNHDVWTDHVEIGSNMILNCFHFFNQGFWIDAYHEHIVMGTFLSCFAIGSDYAKNVYIKPCWWPLDWRDNNHRWIQHSSKNELRSKIRLKMN